MSIFTPLKKFFTGKLLIKDKDAREDALDRDPIRKPTPPTAPKRDQVEQAVDRAASTKHNYRAQECETFMREHSQGVNLSEMALSPINTLSKAEFSDSLLALHRQYDLLHERLWKRYRELGYLPTIHTPIYHRDKLDIGGKMAICENLLKAIERQDDDAQGRIRKEIIKNEQQMFKELCDRSGDSELYLDCWS